MSYKVLYIRICDKAQILETRKVFKALGQQYNILYYRLH